MLLKIKDAVRKLKISRSLRVRLFLIILLMGTVPSVCMRYGIMDNYEEQAVSLRTRLKFPT